MVRRTHAASATARTDTHAPCSMKRSATAVCLALSRVNSRTSTLVSTASIALCDTPPDCLLHLLDRRPFGWPVWKQSLVNVQGRILPCALDDNLIALFLPFDH